MSTIDVPTGAPAPRDPQGPNWEGANPDGANPDGANPDGANPDGANPDGANVEVPHPAIPHPDIPTQGGQAGRRAASGTRARLVRAEWLRLFSRRFTLVMLLTLGAALLVTFFTTMANSHRPSAAEVATARQAAAQMRVQMAAQHADCVRANGPEVCGWADPAAVRYENFLDHVFVYSHSIRTLLAVLAVFLGLFGFLVGASFVGAELDSGGMTNLLLWRPRRGRVLGAKLAVLLAGVLAVTVAATVVFTGVLWLLALTMGHVGGASAGFWWSLVLMWLRALVLILAATCVGFALATLGGRTSAALGVVAGYLVVWELGGRVMLSLINTPNVEQLLLSSYLAAWGSGRTQIYQGTCFGAVNCTSSFEVTPLQAAAVLVLLLAGFLTAAFTAFRRRDMA